MIQWVLLLGAFLGGYEMAVQFAGPPPGPQFITQECPKPPPQKKCASHKDLEGALEKFQTEVFYCVLEKHVLAEKCEQCFKALGEMRDDYLDCLNTKYN